MDRPLSFRSSAIRILSSALVTCFFVFGCASTPKPTGPIEKRLRELVTGIQKKRLTLDEIQAIMGGDSGEDRDTGSRNLEHGEGFRTLTRYSQELYEVAVYFTGADGDPPRLRDLKKRLGKYKIVNESKTSTVRFTEFPPLQIFAQLFSSKVRADSIVQSMDIRRK